MSHRSVRRLTALPVSWRRVPLEELDPLLSEDGWAYASTPPVEPGDLGRFHALFGRDGLICALQVMPAANEVARATLRALAARQGRAEDPEIEEEPGKIGHEFRAEAPASSREAGYAPPRDGAFRYYATSDATSWFLVVLERLGDAALAAELEPSWRAAAALAGRRAGARRRLRAPRARAPARRADPDRAGATPARAPTAAASPRRTAAWRRARWPTPTARPSPTPRCASLARLTGDDGLGRPARAALSAAVSEAFGPDVMALDGDGRPVPGAGSQLGWLLWSGVLEPAAAPRGRRAPVRAGRADRVGPAHAVGRATRRSTPTPTTAAASGRSTPGSAGAACGPRGASGEAERVRSGVLAALERLGRAPELYAVTREGELEPLAAVEPRAGVVGRCPLGARARLGRPRQRGGPLDARTISCGADGTYSGAGSPPMAASSAAAAASPNSA